MDIPSKLSKFIQPGKVFIFSKSFCPYCDKVKDLFKTHEVNFNSVEVDTNNELKNDQEFISLLNKHSKINTYPKVYLGSNCIGGYTDTYKLSQNMKLFSMMKKEKIRFVDDDMI